MDDDGTAAALSFDFEGGLDTATAPTNANPLAPSDPSSNSTAAAQTGPGPANQRRSFRQTVCRHWLRGLCMKGDLCGFLHQYDKERMPVCRFFRQFGECREPDCAYKHSEDFKECNMYKLGFCPNGPDCRYRHPKQLGPPPPVEEVLQKIQQLSSFNNGSGNRFFQQRNTNYNNQQAERPQLTQNSGMANMPTAVKPAVAVELPNMQQQQSQIQLSQPQHVSENQAQKIPNGLSSLSNRTASPLPQGQSRYFVVKSCNRENLEISVQQGVWATQRSNEAKLNEAFESTENVILIFSVNRTQHFQGCAKMASKIGGYIGGGNWKYAHGSAHYGRNFSVKWLKLCELSFNKTRHLRNPYNENLPVKISRDCQELEPFTGEQLASMLYLEPDSQLTEILIAAESKREEEEAKGVSTEDAPGNPDIVLFEDNEEEEEEDSEEEEDGMGHTAQGRVVGRGRGGMMWPNHMPMVQGGRPPLRGFPPVLMGADGFSIPPRGMFTPYGPRFPGDFAGAGFMFTGRPLQPGVFPMSGFGMMMGNAIRAPFMGGIGRPSRPIRASPLLPVSRSVKRDQRRSTNDGNEPTPDQGGKRNEVASENGGGDRFDSRTSRQYDESESEDEVAPRRSRYGEGKKKRRESEGPEGSDRWETPISEDQNQ